MDIITFLEFISEAALEFVYTVYLIILLQPISSNADIKKIIRCNFIFLFLLTAIRKMVSQYQYTNTLAQYWATNIKLAY